MAGASSVTAILASWLRTRIRPADRPQRPRYRQVIPVDGKTMRAPAGPTALKCIYCPHWTPAPASSRPRSPSTRSPTRSQRSHRYWTRSNRSWGSQHDLIFVADALHHPAHPRPHPVPARATSHPDHPDPHHRQKRQDRDLSWSGLTRTPDDTTVICADEIGPLILRAYRPNPAGPPTATGSKGRGVSARPKKYLGLRGPANPRRTRGNHVRRPPQLPLLPRLPATTRGRQPDRQNRVVITDDLSSHLGINARTTHRPSPNPAGIHPEERLLAQPARPWWRRFRRQGLAGQESPTPADIHHATTVTTIQLNSKAKPWIWGRPPPPKRIYQPTLTYRI